MGLILSRRVGSDPFYLSYEKSFEKIAAKESKVQARKVARARKISLLTWWSRVAAGLWAFIAIMCWATARESGQIHSMPIKVYWTAVGLTFGVPALLVLLAAFLGKLMGVLAARDATYLKRLTASKQKMLKDLKDSTHFEKTMQLLRKYDPDTRPPPAATPVPGTATGNNQKRGGVTPSVTTPAAMVMTAAAGAGKALLPMFDTLANSVIGDNPQLVGELRSAQEEVDRLRKENAMLRSRLAQLGGEAAGQPDGPPPGGVEQAHEEGAVDLSLPSDQTTPLVSSDEAVAAGSPALGGGKGVRRRVNKGSRNEMSQLES